MPVLASIFAVLIAVAQPLPPLRAHIPPDSPAWWTFDPSGFNPAQEQPGPERTVLNAGLRSLISSGLIGDDQSTRIVQSVLAASIVGSVPHTLCILEIGQAPTRPGSKPAVRISAVLALHSGADHKPFVRTIEAILTDAAPAGEKPRQPGSQRRIELPGGRSGVCYSEAGWPEWREVSWCSTEGSFVVGLGNDSLARWFRAQDAREAVPNEPRPSGRGNGDLSPRAVNDEWLAHERVVAEARPDGDIFLEAFINLNALRRAFPDAFPGGRLEQLLRSSNLANGRAFMLHARWIKPQDVKIGRIEGQYNGPPLIALDATWSARSEPPGSVRRMALTESDWPAELSMPPPPGGYIAVVPLDVDRWLARALDIYGATLETPAASRFTLRRRAWHSKHSAALGRVSGALGPWLVVSDYPKPPIPMLGAATIYAELRRREGGRSDTFTADLGALLEPFADHVTFDAASQIWSLRADRNGWFQVLSWGLAKHGGRDVLVGGIDMGVPGAVSWRTVEKNREWLR